MTRRLNYITASLCMVNYVKSKVEPHTWNVTTVRARTLGVCADLGLRLDVVCKGVFGRADDGRFGENGSLHARCGDAGDGCMR